MLLATGVTVVVALCVTAILLAGSRTQEASRDSASEDAARNHVPAKDHSPAENPRLIDENEALVADARSYAKDFDVSLEEAIRRLKMQGDTLPSHLERELRRNERDTFAGLWLRHRPDYGITVATAGDPETMMEKVEPYVEGTHWEGTVRIKRVEATEIELNAARREAERMIDALGIRYESWDEVMANRVVVRVRDKTKLQRKLRASSSKLPGHVIVIEGNFLAPS